MIDDQWIVGAVRVRAAAADPFAGLRGHAYIAARGLNASVPRLDPQRDAREAAVLNVLTQRGAIAPAPFQMADLSGNNYAFASGSAAWNEPGNRRFWVADTKKRRRS